MNKYKSALDNIALDINEGVIYSTDLVRMLDDLNTLQELVEKATPKKVVDIDTYIDFGEGYTGYSGICPTCREWCYDNHDSCYCGGCGQAILWSQEEEK